jgi:hypothetical protein
MSAVPSHFSAATHPSVARVYRRRRPERTALYKLVQQHVETWLARRRESDPDAAPIPRQIEHELRGFLECGIRRAAEKMTLARQFRLRAISTSISTGMIAANE